MAFEKVTRLDAMSVRERDGKSYWSRVGVAFPAKQGPGWTLYLDSVPAPVDGQYKIMLMEPKPRDAVSREGAGSVGGGSPFPPDDREIPFAPF